MVPGFKTELQPTSTLSPIIAPTFFKLVSSFSSKYLIITNFLSDFTLEIIEPAPKCDLYPKIESPT